MTSKPTQPFDDIRDLCKSMPASDAAIAQSVMELTQSLGRGLRPIGDLALPLSRIAKTQGAQLPQLNRPLIAIFAGTHGVAGEGAIAASQARVVSMTEGAAPVRGIASEMGAAYKVYEFGVEYPSADFTKETSLSERDCAAAIAFGMEVVAEGADVIVLGGVGLGAATAAAGIARGLYGGAADYWAGGIDSGAKGRVAAVSAGANLHKDNLEDPLNVLRTFGGREIAGMVGAILAAGHQRIPVILDGYVVCAAAAIIHAVSPAAVSHCIAGHLSKEPAHGALLDRMHLAPVLNLGLNIGDGTGGAMALQLLKSAAAGLSTLNS